MADPTVQHFLQGPNLRKVFAHLCNNATGQVTDPIAYVVHIMLTCPVQMVVSEVGVALFKVGGGLILAPFVLAASVQSILTSFPGLPQDHPNALYPFTAMDMGQRLYVEGVVTSCMDWRSKRAATAVPSAGGGERGGKGASIPPGRSCNVVMQMGGGCILHIASGGGGRKGGGVLLGAREVMEALCDCIFSSRRWGWFLKGVLLFESTCFCGAFKV